MPYRSIPRRIKTDSDKDVHVRRLDVDWKLTPEAKVEPEPEVEVQSDAVEEPEEKPARKRKASDD